MKCAYGSLHSKQRMQACWRCGSPPPRQSHGVSPPPLICRELPSWASCWCMWLPTVLPMVTHPAQPLAQLPRKNAKSAAGARPAALRWRPAAAPTTHLAEVAALHGDCDMQPPAANRAIVGSASSAPWAARQVRDSCTSGWWEAAPRLLRFAGVLGRSMCHAWKVEPQQLDTSDAEGEASAAR